jgi:hypothetical protein
MCGYQLEAPSLKQAYQLILQYPPPIAPVQVLISAPKAIFELIVFLLLHDAVNADDRRICCLSCETSFAHGWHISIQSLSLERHKDHRYNSQVRYYALWLC